MKKRSAKPKRMRRGDGKVAFFGLLREIAMGLDRRETQTAIYERHKDRLNISLRQFSYLVSRYQNDLNAAIGKLHSYDRRAPPSDRPEAVPDRQAPRQPLFIRPDEQADFHFDPMDAYRKKWD
jgi:hypothetical protein